MAIDDDRPAEYTVHEVGPDPAVYTAAEVAALFGCSEWQVYQRVKEGVIPKVPFLGARMVRIPKTWVHEQLDAAAHPTKPDGAESP